MRAYVFREQQPPVGMVKLFPVTEAAKRFLVLLLKSMCVYRVNVSGVWKVTGDVSIRLFLKSPELFGVTDTFTHYVKINRDAETLAGTDVCPPATAYNQYDLMVTDRKIGDAYRGHESLGLKMNVTRQTGMNPLIKTNMNLGRSLFNTCYLKIIQYF